ncbi:MAG TPA: hypothetical protein VG327_18225 [Mycobacterium sp.]|nr:hypothetical protein [Mycobacterium sp.]
MNDGIRTQAPRMCNIETIDAELRLLWRAWRVAREMGYAPNTAFIDALLDERAAWQSPSGMLNHPTRRAQSYEI